EVLSRALAGTTIPPSAHAVGIPAALDAVVLRGLRAAERERFQTAREMARAIEAAIPPLALSRIGDWVESIMGSVLAERAARIAEIERDSASRVPEPSATADRPTQTQAAEVPTIVELPSAAGISLVGHPSQDHSRYKSGPRPMRAIV